MNINSFPKNKIEQLKINEDIFPYIQDINYFNLASVLTRLDFVKDKQGEFKLVEINADTPCAFVEAYYANQIACDFYNMPNTNKDKEQDIEQIFRKTINIIKPDQTFVFATSVDYLEDYATTKYIQSIIKKGYLIDLKYLVIKEDGVYFNDSKIDVLYLLYPKEMLLQDKSEDGYPVGLKLIELASQGNVILINPIEAILLQNKLLQAFIWEIKDSDFFTDEEKQTINRNMIPSFFNTQKLEGTKYIKKEIFGRLGQDISIFDEKNKLIEQTDSENNEKGKEYLFQKFIETDLIKGVCSSGEIDGKITYSNFVIDGKSSAFYARFDISNIAGLDAFWQPISYKE